MSYALIHSYTSSQKELEKKKSLPNNYGKNILQLPWKLFINLVKYLKYTIFSHI